MGRTIPPILVELRQPSSTEAQIAALRGLKNEVIGHEQKKEWWISLGVVKCLERTLSTHRSSSKRRQRDVHNNGVSSNSASDEEEARLLAVIIVGSLADGGPKFIYPLRTGMIYPPILDILCPTESAPSLVLAALRSLISIADAVILQNPKKLEEEDAFLRLLYSEQHLSVLGQILDQDATHPIIQQQVSLVASLISKTCKTEARRKQLRFCGILNSLATRLASFIVTPGYIPAMSLTLNPDSRIRPAGSRARLAPLLQAICTIIQESKIRVSNFCCSAAFASIFPSDKDPYSWRVPLAPSGKREPPSISIETLQPLKSQISGKGSNYPPMNSFATWGKQQTSQRAFSSAMEIIPTESFASQDHDETHLVPWLVEVVRAKSGMTRLMAIWLIALMFRSNSVSPHRSRDLSMQLIPILAGMLDKDSKISDDEELPYDLGPSEPAARTILQRAPRVLALFVAENEEFQRAAADADVIKKLSQLLKQSYDPIPPASMTAMWNPIEGDVNDARDHSNSSKLGPDGLMPIQLHTVRMRESALIALNAMATSKDEYRKAIIDNGVVPFIIESLKPHDQPAGAEDKVQNRQLGNPITTLIAACNAARALSRSVSSLRTTLVDKGLADPIYKLLRHPDLEVQIAATSASINLILEFSSMRGQMIDAGVLSILCEHAHSFNPKLRLNAVWALKHLVLSAPNHLKIKCVQELGIGWLKQIICNGTEDGIIESHRTVGDRGSTPIAMGTPNAAGEQVDLLNAMDDRSQGSNFNQDDEDDEVNMVDSVGPLSRHGRFKSSRFATMPAAEQSTTQYDHPFEMRDEDDPTAVQNARDDLAIQEQGLTFVRNLICGPHASDMVDYLLGELGQDKVFDMLTNLLKPKSVDVFSSRRPGGSGPKLVPPPTEVLAGVCYIMVHLAGSVPKHRQMLIAKPELLRLLIPLFNHPHPDVRVSCVWTVFNLTWTDDQADKLHSKTRANELRKLGVLNKLHELENDLDLDVRERTKMTIAHMNEQLRL